MPLPDPRVYSSAGIKNNIIGQLNQNLSASDWHSKRKTQTALEFLISQHLENNQEEALAIALSLVPSQNAYKHLWQTIKSLISPAAKRQYATIFALPLILIVGSSELTVLPNYLDETDSLIQLLKSYQIIDSAASVSLSSQLYTGDKLASIKLSQLYHFQRACSANQALSIKLTADPIQFNNQGVILRYLFGVIEQDGKMSEADSIAFQPIAGKVIMNLAQYFQQKLGRENLTLFAIPRGPQPILDALEEGQQIYSDIALQVFVSNTIKKYRSQNKTLTASLACHADHQIKLVISTLQSPEIWESFIWPLQPLDHPAAIGQQILELLRQCQLENIFLLEDTQPTFKHEQPLFITPAQVQYYQ